MEYITHSPEETEALGAEYAKSSKQAMLLRSPATSVPARRPLLRKLQKHWAWTDGTYQVPRFLS